MTEMVATQAIYALVKTALSDLGVPVSAGIFRPADGANLPDTYICYFLITNTGEEYAEDGEISDLALIQVSVFTKAGLYQLPNVKAAMKAAGFTFEANRELDYSEQTGHYGMAFDFYYLLDA